VLAANAHVEAAVEATVPIFAAKAYVLLAVEAAVPNVGSPARLE
jgi:hypothetical protein